MELVQLMEYNRQMNKNVFRKPAEGRMEAVEVVAVAFTFYNVCT